MEKKELLQEIESYKSKSRFKIKTIILFLRVIKNVNTDVFYLLLSLSIGFLISYLIGISILLFLFTHFISWVIISPYILNKKTMTEENDEINFIINELIKYLQNKNGMS
jgi:uncharacterized membrane protein